MLNGYDKNFCRIHDLRGQYVDTMQALGIPTPYISREVGHARTSTTNDIYTSGIDEVYTEMNAKLDSKLFS